MARPHFNDKRGQSTERVLAVNYDLAFRIVGPNPRAVRKEKKIGRAIKWPDGLVLRVREMGKRMRACGIAVQLEREANGAPAPHADWVQRVLDGIIRNNVKEN